MAICEQTEDPKVAKGLVKREVVRVITPGTVIDPVMLTSSAATYLMALSPGTKGSDWGIALLDISTGEFFVSALSADGIPGSIRSEIARYRPAECIVSSGIEEDLRDLMRRDGVVVTPYTDDRFLPDLAFRTLCEHFGVATLARLWLRCDAGCNRCCRCCTCLCRGNPALQASPCKWSFHTFVYSRDDA